ncbi:LAETG motif-containing sortase-dependent surface protein [Streptomyces cavernae]|uniref:LAETG motif-containing sortase-dependent surface protein n=1 Tax=Streptomyces cavernae TaxID=2259034 RepID=UPI000FEB9140|nr:LAETG motif-containing sortase-dependent surface protein [Streptomyces cavernae]
MSISSRTARSVRILGVASAAAALALTTAGSALANDIRDFSAAALCDENGEGVISVTDKDASGTPATITLYLGDELIGTNDVKGSRKGETITFSEEWAPNTIYRVHVLTKGKVVDDYIEPDLITPSKACGSSTATTPPASAPPQPPENPAQSPSGSTSPGAGTVVASPAAGPSERSAPAPQAGGTSDLAATGAGVNTGAVAGIAVTLVAAGGGVVFALRKRGTSRTSNTR